jgi:hypothetical protein
LVLYYQSIKKQHTFQSFLLFTPQVLQGRIMSTINNQHIPGGEYNRISRSGNGKPTTKPGHILEKSFASILSQSIDTKEESPRSTSVNTLYGLSEIQSPIPVMANEPSQAPLLDGLDGAVTLLESYAALLGDPSKNLKEIYPALQALIHSVDTLAGNNRRDVAVPDDLDTMVQQLVSIARIEQAKLIRGDYTDP